MPGTIKHSPSPWRFLGTKPQESKLQGAVQEGRVQPGGTELIFTSSMGSLLWASSL